MINEETKKKIMEERLREKRDKIYYEVWRKNQADLSMKELAEIFTIPLPSLYRIVKTENQKDFLKGRQQNKNIKL